MIRGIGRTALAPLLLIGSLAACSASGPTTGPAPTTTPDRPTGSTTVPDAEVGDDSPPSSDPPSPTLSWSPCGTRFECADLEVPLDHDDPDGPTTTIALNRRAANDPEQRIGALVFNPGGPGGSGKQIVTQLLFPREILDRFDIVGFDPRGVGDSDGLDCNTHLQALYDADPTMEDAADERTYLEISETFIAECEDKYGEILPHLGTVDVAHDLDRIRAALGDEQLNFVGYSYGTSIGQQYARLYPERVRTMVIDGVVDQTVDGVDAAATQAAGFELALANYIRSCDADRCFDDDTRTVIERVVAAAEKAPIPAPNADRPATPGVVNLALGYPLYSEFLWRDLTNALDAADRGDGSGLVDLADGYLNRSPDGSYDGGFEIYFAVSCLDSPWPDDPDAFFAEAKDAAKISPTFGEAIVNDYVRCALWPTPPQPLEPVPADIEGLAPLLVVSTTGDPATPYENGVQVARQIPGARLLSYEGEGHTIFLQGNGCVDDVGVDYLLTGTVPDDDVTC